MKEHPRDIFDRDQIARAVYFTAFIRHSPTESVRVQCESKQDAFDQADRLDKTNRFGRRACCYAVTPEGWSIPLSRPSPQTPHRR